MGFNENIFIDKLYDYDLEERLIYIKKSIYKHKKEIYNSDDLQEVLSSSYVECIKAIRKRYSIDNYRYLISNQISIISSNHIIQISPLIMSFEVWKELILYEFSLFNRIEFESKKRLYISYIEELTSRIGTGAFINYDDLFFTHYSYSHDLNKWLENSRTKKEFEEHEEAYDKGYVLDVINLLDFEDFMFPSSNYTGFLYNLNLSDLWNFEENQLNKRLKRLELLVENKDKIILNPDYTQNDILKFFNAYNKKHYNLFDKSFIVTRMAYQKEMPSHFYLKNDIAESNYKKPLSKEEVLDALSLLKYLKQKGVFANTYKKTTTRINSDRKLAKIITHHFDINNSLSFEAIRKKLAEKDSLELLESIQFDLNYFLKSTQTKN